MDSLPAEVIVPALLARVEEWGQHVCQGIDAGETGAFVQVAIDAGETEV